MGDEGIDQCSVGVSGSGMDHQAGRLVQDHDLLILEQDIQGDILALRLGWTRFGDDYGESLACRNFGRGLCDGLAITGDLPRFDQGFQPTA